ncbi:MAG: hypothetical protein L0228_07320 [Planctomycetes bacterium]|nr:hypothetical protein [Planctomycetota bacterium]
MLSSFLHLVGCHGQDGRFVDHFVHANQLAAIVAVSERDAPVTASAYLNPERSTYDGLEFIQRDAMLLDVFTVSSYQKNS